MSRIMRELFDEAARARRAADPDRERRRYSSDESDTDGYLNWVRIRPCRVSVDGKFVEKAITADEVAGTVVAHKFPYEIEDSDTVKVVLTGAVLVEPVEAD